jgi:myo-inositol-1-phosphate synthase
MAPKGEESIGLMHYDLAGYRPEDIEVAAAFDIDKRKVGKPVNEAIFALPNCTKIFCEKMPRSRVKVMMGEAHDGISKHMMDYPEDRAFRVANAKPVNVAKVLKDSGAEILVNYLPVGSERGTRFYASCCLESGLAFVNCIPVFVVSDPKWGKKFEQAGLPCVGDDIKAQLGATITHRVLTKLFVDRGVKLDRTYQLNTGGNTDFLNMLNRARLKSKKISKTDAVQSQLETPLPWSDVHIGPADYVPWQLDNKVCFLRMEGRGFGGVPLNIELRLSVEDSPNSAGVAIDAIRCARVGLDRKIGGPLISIASYTMKHPPKQFSDSVAQRNVEAFISGEAER